MRLLGRRRADFSFRLWAGAMLAVAVLVPAWMSSYGQAGSRPEEIEWTWEVRPVHPDAKLPNVLLLGDSITRDYFPEVKKELDGAANVYLMAASTSVGDPRISAQLQEFAAMEGVRFRVVHLNNGMHGWEYSEAEYEGAFRGYLEAVKRLLDDGGRLVWASITPVRSDTPNGASNARIDARNAIAEKIAQAEKLALDDQHKLMLGHQDLHADAVHFTPAGAALQGKQAAASIRAALAQAK